MHNSNKALVAVCDLLGFTQFVSNNEGSKFQVVLDHYRDLLAIQHDIDNKGTDLVSVLGQLAGAVWISDSLIIYSLQNNKSSFDKVIEHAMTILCASNLIYSQSGVACEGRPFYFRIGVAYGDFYYDRVQNVFLGKALIDAQKLEKQQKWSGGALTADAAKAVGNSKNLIEYAVPSKEGTLKSMVLNWTLMRHEKMLNTRWLPRVLDNDISDIDKNEIERKILETEKFHEQVCTSCKKTADDK